MLKLRTLAAAIGAAALVGAGAPALAGSWPNLPAKPAAQSPATTAPSDRAQSAIARVERLARAAGDFEPANGEAGWQLRQHQYVLSGGTLAHAETCTLVAGLSRAAPAVPRNFEPAGAQLPGA